MNLLEVLLAAVVFLSASAASLQLWSQAGSLAVRTERRQELLDRLDGVVLMAEARWREMAAGGPGEGACGPVAAELAVRLQGMPAVTGVERAVAQSADGEAVQVRLQADGLDVERRRLFSPAAAGLCDGAP